MKMATSTERVLERELLRAADDEANLVTAPVGAALAAAGQRRRELFGRDLEPGHAGAAAGQLAREEAAATPDVEDVLTARLDQPVEDR